MFSVLIVDDDKLIIDDLFFLIDWKAVECVPPESARNGKEALFKMQQKAYDIVITDISMPIMDGVELIKQAKEQHLTADFLVISNYDDFTYVKEAMKYGALEYILKYEITADSFLSQIKYAQVVHKDRMNTRNTESNNYLRNTIRQLYHHTFKGEEPTLELGGGAWVPIVLVLYDEIHEGKLKTALNDALDATECITYYCSEVGRGRELLLLNVDTPSALMAITMVSEFLRTLFSLLESEDVRVSAAINQVCGTSKEAVQCIKTLVEEESHYFMMAPGKVSVAGITEQKSNPSNMSLTALCQSLEKASAEEVQKTLLQYFMAEGVGEDKLKAESAAAVNELSGGLSEDSETIIADIWHAWTAWQVCEALTRFLKRERASNNVGTRREIVKAVEYIKTHFSQPISLAQLSEVADLSTSYLSKIFKEEMGMNYTEYLNTYRMDMAKKLLKTTSLKANEIAEKVGIPDYRYFSRLFKEETGMTCLEYRRGDSR